MRAWTSSSPAAQFCTSATRPSQRIPKRCYQSWANFGSDTPLTAVAVLVQAGVEAAQRGATDAGAQAGENAAVAAEFGAKVAELAAKVAAAYFSGGASLAA